MRSLGKYKVNPIEINGVFMVQKSVKMGFLFHNNEYGFLGYFILILPAILVLLVLLLGYFIIDFLIKRLLKHDLKKQSIAYGVYGGIVTTIMLFTFYQGTFTETVYVAIPTNCIAFLVLRRFKMTSKVRFSAKIWLIILTVLFLISFFRAFALL